MAKTNRTCYFCGRGYYFCPNCNDKRDPKIYGMFDSEVCKQAFDILKGEFLKKVTTSEAKEKLVGLGVTEKMIVAGKDTSHLKRVLDYSEDIVKIETVSEIESKTEDKIEIETNKKLYAIETEENIDIINKEEMLINIEETDSIPETEVNNKVANEVVDEVSNKTEPIKPTISTGRRNRKRNNKNSEVI